jgi:carbamoyl-phosphate synthase small subunit
MEDERLAVLVLNDGTYFEGIGYGASEKVAAEVVFNSTMVGYPGILTDPTYYGQILLMTYPLIGNIGIADPNVRDEFNIPQFFESDYDHYAPKQQATPYDSHPNPHLFKNSALIVSELCKQPSHWKIKMSLDETLKKEGIPGIQKIDTRELMKKFRDEGECTGILQVFEGNEEPDIEGLQNEASEIPNPAETSYVKNVSVKEPMFYEQENGASKIILIDLGTKMTIIRSFLNRKVAVVRVPYNFSIEKILDYNPDGVVISNGPGNPNHADLKSTVQTIQAIVEKEIPLLGIGLGNQLFSLAMGAELYRMKCGHRSPNQTSMDLGTKRCYATIQNHGYAVNKDSLDKTDLELWFENVNDYTVEGVKHKRGKAVSVEFYPELQPAPIDAKFVYDQFVELLKS